MGLKPTATQGRIFADAIGLTKEALGESFGKKVNLAPVYMAISRWIVMLDYREMMLGLAHVPLSERASNFNNAFLVLQNPQIMSDPKYFSYANSLIGKMYGNSRMSEPIARRHVTERFSKVWVEGFKLPLSRTLDKAVAKESVKKDLFEQHKNDLVGVSKPFGFGYKVPDQVKLEYLSLELNGSKGLKRLVVSQIKPAEMKRFYDKNKEILFRRDAASVERERKANNGVANEYRNYPDVFDEIKDIVISRKATELGIWAIGEARTMMITQAKQKLSSNDGYYDTSRKSWKPISLEKVADEVRVKIAKRLNIEESASITPNFKVLNQKWYSSETLAGVASLGEKYGDAGKLTKIYAQNPSLRLSTAQKQGTWFELGDYAMTVKELNAEKRNPRFKRLQTTIASRTLVMFEDSYSEIMKPTGLMLFRVTDALPSHAPKSMSEVDVILTADAKRVDAFEKLKLEANKMQQAFDEGEAEDLAKTWKLDLVKTDGFTRQSPVGGKLEASYVYGVGQDESFVTAAFNIAANIYKAGGVELSEKGDRTFVEPIEDDMSLVVGEVVKIDNMKKSMYESVMGDSSVLSFAVKSMLTGIKSSDVLTFDAVAKRVNYMDETDYQKAKEGEAKPEIKSDDKKEANAE